MLPTHGEATGLFTYRIVKDDGLVGGYHWATCSIRCNGRAINLLRATSFNMCECQDYWQGSGHLHHPIVGGNCPCTSDKLLSTQLHLDLYNIENGNQTKSIFSSLESFLICKEATHSNEIATPATFMTGACPKGLLLSRLLVLPSEAA